MIAALRTPVRRLVLAVLISILLHSSVMWVPRMRLPHFDTEMPPLTVRLEPLPPRPYMTKPEPVKAVRPSRAAPSQTVDQPTSLLPQSAVVPANAPDEMQQAQEPAPKIETLPVPVAVVPEGYWTKPVLPKHAQLDFAVYQGGTASFRIGEARHALDIVDGRYVLQAETRTVGLVNFFKSFRLAQSSRGVVDNNGLRPERYQEERVASGNAQKLEAVFDWPAKTLNSQGGGKAELPDDALDTLSMLYQLSQVRMDNKEIVALHIGNGKKLEYYEFEIAQQEEIDTPMGKLRTLHLRKLHNQNEEGMEVWLGLEYRMLPVKVRHLDRAGEVSGEAIIAGIRVSDE
jgi:hypothetical protein